MRPPHLGERDPKKRPKNALKGIVQETFSAILEVLVLSDAGVLSRVLCSIFRVAKRLERWRIARFLRPPHSRAQGTPKSGENPKNLRISDPQTQDPEPGLGEADLGFVLSDAEESGSDLGTIFRVAA